MVDNIQQVCLGLPRILSRELGILLEARATSELELLSSCVPPAVHTPQLYPSLSPVIKSPDIARATMPQLCVGLLDIRPRFFSKNLGCWRRTHSTPAFRKIGEAH